jgi:hypothetical protein
MLLREASIAPDVQVTPEMVRQFWDMFVNRRAYTVQSKQPHAETGRHYYFRPRGPGGSPLALDDRTIRMHLQGRLTIGLYATNPKNQTSKWIAIDADYRHALEDLLSLHCELGRDGVEAALEKSRRGAHLWVFFDAPVLSRQARLYVLNLATRLKLPVKGSGLPDGIEIFPRQDMLRPGEFGNAIRAPLGVHQGAGKRYWFYHADYSLPAQFTYLASLRRVGREQLGRFTCNLDQGSTTREVERAQVLVVTAGRDVFRILDYVDARRKVGRNYVARCPSCAAAGRDTAGDNLAISVDEPLKYKCWAGCTREMIRAALGRPIARRNP